MTVVIAPGTAGATDQVSTVLDAEAIVEWGTIDGTSPRTEVDVGAGTAFGVIGTRLIVSLRSIGVTPAHPRKSRYHATASLGEAAGKFAPVRVIRFGSLDAGATSDLRAVPAFARRLFLVRSPQGAIDVRYFDGLGVEIGTARSREGEEPALIVAPGVRGFSVTNVGVAALGNIRAVFELNFEG